MKKVVSVCIVDNNNNLRGRLEKFISKAVGFKCIGSVASVHEAKRIIQSLKPDVVVIDINCDTEEREIDCVRELKSKMPFINFMIYTENEEDDKIFEAFRAGVGGYLLKKTSLSKMLEAINELYQGGVPMSSRIARKVVGAFSKKNQEQIKESELLSLSILEKEILELLSKGKIYKEISATLFISIDTVRKYIHRIYEKLQVKNRVEAVNRFFGR